MESLQVSEIFQVNPGRVFSAWLDSGMHGEMIGGKAEIEPVNGGKFIIWDGYITGTTIGIIPNEKIVQKWRTTEFPEYSPDSTLEVIFEETKEGTRLTIHQTDIPPGQSEKYKKGWVDHYFIPMKEYFSASA